MSNGLYCISDTCTVALYAIYVMGWHRSTLFSYVSANASSGRRMLQRDWRTASIMRQGRIDAV